MKDEKYDIRGGFHKRAMYREGIVQKRGLGLFADLRGAW